MMRAANRLSRRGVSLIEGMVATLVLLLGVVGVLQGLAIASVQNSMANRHTRASVIAQEVISAIEQQGRARLFATTPSAGLFTSTNCLGTVPNAVAAFKGELNPVPSALSGAGFSACYIDFDSLGTGFTALTPAYSAQDNTTYSRLIAVYTNSTNSEILYVGVNVGWRDGGRVRVVKRFTALYDTAVNQTNLEY
jgi:hypothetical protein